MVSLKWGLATSHNWVSAWLFKNFNPENVITLMRKMGVTSHIDPVPSMIYGPNDISLEEMVGAFNTFGNRGIYVRPIYVSRIEDRYGNVDLHLSSAGIGSHQQGDGLFDAFSAEKCGGYGPAATRVSLITEHAIRLRWKYQFTGELAGKTGTTQNQSDGWFIGLAPKLTAAAWVGGEDRSIHFDNLTMGSGTNMALPIYAEFLTRVYADSTLGITMEDEFERPLDFYVDMDCPDIMETSSRVSSTIFRDFCRTHS